MWDMSWRGANASEKFFLAALFLILLVRTPVFWFLVLVVGLFTGGGYYLGHLR